MAQLSNDCFAIGDAPLTIDDALAYIAARVPAVAKDAELLPLAACDGRVLDETALARSALPAFANAAVDGYAVRHADLSPGRETTLPVAGRIMAGAPDAPALAALAAVRIFTGAPLPEGADTVFMQEDARVDGQNVILPAGLRRGANARDACEELEAGQVLFSAGVRLMPQHLALAAGAGFDRLPVRRRVRAAIFSTGDELVEPGSDRIRAQVYDTNRLMLASLLRRAGCDVSDLGILRDEPTALTDALKAAASGHDLILTSGGVSAGEADHIKDAVAAAGRLDHWRFAIKPGRPLAIGVIDGCAFVGLPGNPVAVFVTFTQVVRAVIAALGGERWTPPRFLPVRAGFSRTKKAGRIEFVRVRLTISAGSWAAEPYPVEGAGIISSLTGSDGLVRLPLEMTHAAPGDPVDYLPFAAMLG